MLNGFGVMARLLLLAQLALPFDPDDAAPSLRRHYSDFIATTSRSVP